MNKHDARVEAAPLLARTLTTLLAAVPSKVGREGSDVRRAIGDLLAHALPLLQNDEAGEPMSLCFDTAYKAGVSMIKFNEVIDQTVAESPVTVGGILTKYCLIQFGLSAISRVIADMVFESRQDVDRVRTAISDTFTLIEEAAADDMDSESYIVLVKLHAALMNHLVETARPLPRLITFRFNNPLTTIVASYRLYDDASRGDDIRAENKVVHPAFLRPEGKALSA